MHVAAILAFAWPGVGSRTCNHPALGAQNQLCAGIQPLQEQLGSQPRILEQQLKTLYEPQ